MVRRLFFVAFFFEVGFVLLLLPWSGYWERNYFLRDASLVQVFLTNNFVRGGISGLGFVNIVVGLSELATRAFSRTSNGHAPIGSIADEP
jgi:hypothetical protein